MKSFKWLVLSLFFSVPTFTFAGVTHFVSGATTKPDRVDLRNGSSVDFDFHHYSQEVESLNAQSNEELQRLLTELAQVEVKLCWFDENEKVRSGKIRLHRSSHWEDRYFDDTNGAVALAMKVASLPDQQALFARMILLAPGDAILPYLKKSASVPLDQHAVAMSLLQILGDESKFRLGADLIHIYLASQSDEKKEVLQERFASLLSEVITLIPNDFSRPERLGVFLGMVVSGGLKYAAEVTDKDNYRIWAFNSATNIIWASTTFLGVVPIAGNIAAGVGGAVSLSVVIANAIYSKNGPRDYASAIREKQGELEWKLKHSENVVDALTLFEAMTIVIHMNGFPS